MPRALLAFPFLVGALVLSPAAHADVAFAPAADGSVGVWLAAGDLPRGTTPADFDTTPSLNAAPGARLRGTRWTLASGGTAALDVRKSIRGNRAALAAVLRIPAPLRGWLFLSVDGRAQVALDGRVVWDRLAPHARGGGWDPIPLDVLAGDHTLLLVLENTAPGWGLETRIVARADLEPPRDLEWRLPGVPEADGQRATMNLLRATASVGLVPGGFQPRVRLEFPRGSPLAPTTLSISANAKGAASAPLVVELPRSARGFLGVDVSLPLRVGTDALDGVRVALAKESRRLPLTVDAGAPVVVERALSWRSRLAVTPPDEGSAPGGGSCGNTDVLSATLEYDAKTLGALADRADPGVFTARARLDAFVSKLQAGKDPLREPGVLLLARRSSLDGEPQRFALHVPASFDPAGDKRYPLVVVLHGYGGYPERVMSAFLGTDSLAPHPRIDGFVLAPHAHGDAFYRGPGETEVMDLVDWATARYPIDPARVSVTGISMGGTGAAHFAFRYPDRFAAAGALAGYHSYFVRRDVRGRPLRPWEWSELARHSPASFAENGLGTFLYLAQGTKDLPLAHTTSLAGRYKELGYPLRETYPDTGHDVFRVAWSGGSLYPVLTKFAREPVPKKVVLKTDSLRLGRRSWVRVTALASPSAPGAITARVAAPETVAVQTDGVTAFELERPAPHVSEAARLDVEVDGVRIGFEPGEPVAAHRDGERGARGWTKGPLPPSPLAKKPGVEGPIRDAFTGPLTFVYGTLDPAETLVARRVAEHFRARWSGNARFPVVADTFVSAPRGQNYFLVGSKASNGVVRALDSRLPFGIDGDTVRLGANRISGDAELGFSAVFPNPEDPGHVVVVVEGRGVQGLVRSMSLPGQLPDFIVFDSGLAPAAGEQVLGSARVRAAGYFDRTWGVPREVADAPLPPSGPLSAVAKVPAFAWERRTLVSVEEAPPP